MKRIDFVRPESGPFRLLCLGAHSDDIEIGAGGTVLTLLSRYPNTEVRWVVFGANDIRAREAEESAALFLGSRGGSSVAVHRYRDGFFPSHFAEIKDEFEKIKKEFTPDLVLTHYRDDLHQDHRVVSDLTWNTFRDHDILEYEIPKYDGDLGRPNFYVELDEQTAKAKVDKLMQSFPSQRTKHWYSADLFLALMRLRGMEAGPAIRHAEAFHARKILF